MPVIAASTGTNDFGKASDASLAEINELNRSGIALVRHQLRRVVFPLALNHRLMAESSKSSNLPVLHIFCCNHVPITFAQLHFT